jgi:hypothetical protein
MRRTTAAKSPGVRPVVRQNTIHEQNGVRSGMERAAGAGNGAWIVAPDARIDVTFGPRADDHLPPMLPAASPR